MAIRERDAARLISNVQIEVGSGVSEEAIKAILFDVVHEFLDLSNIWVEWIPVPIGPQTQMYIITPKYGGDIIRLVTFIDNNGIRIAAGLSFGPAPASSVTPPSFADPPAAVLSLFYQQTNSITANALVIKNVILPEVADGLPDAPVWLLPKYERYIKEGVVGFLMIQPDKPYTNTAMGKGHVMRFKDGAMMARVAAERSNIYGGQSWRYPRQFRTGSQRGGVSTPYPDPTIQGF